MKKTVRKDEMKDIVGRYFIRVCKNHKIYGKFKTSFFKVMRYRSDSNPFGNFKNVCEMFNMVNDFTEREYEKNRRTNDKYEKVTMMINHMIHFFLEKGGVNPRRLGMIGQEVFDLSCYGIYGDEFLEDMERMQQEQPKPRTNKEAWLMSEYIKEMSNGSIHMTWEEFKNRYLPQLEGIDNIYNMEQNNQMEEIDPYEDYSDNEHLDDDIEWFDDDEVEQDNEPF